MELVNIRVVTSQTGSVSNTAVVTGNELDLAPLNNTCTKSNTIGHKDGPDLVVSYLSVKPPVCKTTPKKTVCSMNTTLLMANRGNQSTGMSYLHIYLSDDATLDSGDTLLSSIKMKPMRPLQTLLKSYKGKLPNDVNTSGKYLITKIDGTNLVVEAVETNNTAVYGPMP